MAEILEFSQVSSTNNVALQLAASGAPHGTIVWAKRQTMGRGRLNRHWFSYDGSLTSSIILRPHLPTHLAHLLIMGTNAAILDCLDGLCPEIKIKWPNDLWSKGQKVGGILTETQRVNSKIRSVVMGIGLNLWPPDHGWPHNLPNPGSVFGQAPRHPAHSKAKILAEIQASILKEVAQLESPQNIRRLLELNRVRSTTLGKRVSYEACSNQTVIGKALDIWENYSLIIQDRYGQIERISVGDVNLI